MKKLRLSLVITAILFQSISFKAFTQKKEKIFSLVPYINYNRTYGGMFGLVPMATFRFNAADTLSPHSLAGVMGFYSTNKSWALSLFSNLYLNEDKWRITIAAATGNANSQFYITDPTAEFINFSANTSFIGFELARKIAKGIFIGGSFYNNKYDNTYFYDTPVDQIIKMNGIGAKMVFDKRNVVYYPTTGHFGIIRMTFYPNWLPNDNTTQQLRFRFNKYFSTRQANQIIAVRASLGLGFGDVPFNKELVVSGVDLRGYTQGKFRGKQLLAFQGEYRVRFKSKLGAVAFAGLASVFNSKVAENDGKILPSIGGGIRYQVFKQTRMNVGIDAAVGKQDWGINFRIGEAF